jgi:hypothetical protein
MQPAATPEAPEPTRVLRMISSAGEQSERGSEVTASQNAAVCELFTLILGRTDKRSAEYATKEKQTV